MTKQKEKDLDYISQLREKEAQGIPASPRLIEAARCQRLHEANVEQDRQKREEARRQQRVPQEERPKGRGVNQWLGEKKKDNRHVDEVRQETARSQSQSPRMSTIERRGRYMMEEFAKKRDRKRECHKDPVDWYKDKKARSPSPRRRDRRRDRSESMARKPKTTKEHKEMNEHKDRRTRSHSPKKDRGRSRDRRRDHVQEDQVRKVRVQDQEQSMDMRMEKNPKTKTHEDNIVKKKTRSPSPSRVEGQSKKSIENKSAEEVSSSSKSVGCPAPVARSDQDVRQDIQGRIDALVRKKEAMDKDKTKAKGIEPLGKGMSIPPGLGQPVQSGKGIPPRKGEPKSERIPQAKSMGEPPLPQPPPKPKGQPQEPPAPPPAKATSKGNSRGKQRANRFKKRQRGKKEKPPPKAMSVWSVASSTLALQRQLADQDERTLKSELRERVIRRELADLRASHASAELEALKGLQAGADSQSCEGEESEEEDGQQSSRPCSAVSNSAASKAPPAPMAQSVASSSSAMRWIPQRPPGSFG